VVRGVEVECKVLRRPSSAVECRLSATVGCCTGALQHLWSQPPEPLCVQEGQGMLRCSYEQFDPRSRVKLRKVRHSGFSCVVAS